MSRVVVKNRVLDMGKLSFPCAIGTGGVSAEKREGDGKTPLGIFRFRECWYRADRVSAPVTRLPLKVIKQDDGWCDDPAHEAYNTHVKLPFPARHEKLWRDDYVYDVIVPLGYNDAPVVPSKGSAIFMHLARADYAGTEGCVALALPDLLKVLAQIGPEDAVTIE